MANEENSQNVNFSAEEKEELKKQLSDEVLKAMVDLDLFNKKNWVGNRPNYFERSEMRALFKYILETRLYKKDPVEIIERIINAPEKKFENICRATFLLLNTHNTTKNPFDLILKVVRVMLDQPAKNIIRDMEDLTIFMDKYVFIGDDITVSDYSDEEGNQFTRYSREVVHSEWKLKLPQNEREDFDLNREKFERELKKNSFLNDLFNRLIQYNKLYVARLISLTSVDFHQMKGLSFETIKRLLELPRVVIQSMLHNNALIRKHMEEKGYKDVNVLEALPADDFELFSKSKEFRQDFLREFLSMKESFDLMEADAEKKKADADAEKEERERLRKKIIDGYKQGSEAHKDQIEKSWKPVDMNKAQKPVDLAKINEYDTLYPGFKNYFYNEMTQADRERFKKLSVTTLDFLMDKLHGKIEPMLKLDPKDFSLVLRMDEEKRNRFFAIKPEYQKFVLSCFKSDLEAKEKEPDSKLDTVQRLFELYSDNSFSKDLDLSYKLCKGYSELPLEDKIYLEKFVIRNSNNLNWTKDVARYILASDEERENFKPSTDTEVTISNGEKEISNVFVDAAYDFLMKNKYKEKIENESGEITYESVYLKDKVNNLWNELYNLDTNFTKEKIKYVLEQNYMSMGRYTKDMFFNLMKEVTPVNTGLVLLATLCTSFKSKMFILHLYPRDLDMILKMFKQKNINGTIEKNAEKHTETLEKKKLDIDNDLEANNDVTKRASNDLEKFKTFISDMSKSRIENIIFNQAQFSEEDAKEVSYLKDLKGKFLRKLQIKLPKEFLNSLDWSNSDEAIKAIAKYVLKNYDLSLTEPNKMHLENAINTLESARKKWVNSIITVAQHIDLPLDLFNFTDNEKAADRIINYAFKVYSLPAELMDREKIARVLFSNTAAAKSNIDNQLQVIENKRLTINAPRDFLDALNWSNPEEVAEKVKEYVYTNYSLPLTPESVEAIKNLIPEVEDKRQVALEEILQVEQDKNLEALINQYVKKVSTIPVRKNTLPDYSNNKQETPFDILKGNDNASPASEDQIKNAVSFAVENEGLIKEVKKLLSDRAKLVDLDAESLSVETVVNLNNKFAEVRETFYNKFKPVPKEVSIGIRDYLKRAYSKKGWTALTSINDFEIFADELQKTYFRNLLVKNDLSEVSASLKKFFRTIMYNKARRKELTFIVPFSDDMEKKFQQLYAITDKDKYIEAIKKIAQHIKTNVDVLAKQSPLTDAEDEALKDLTHQLSFEQTGENNNAATIEKYIEWLRILEDYVETYNKILDVNNS